MMWLPGKTYYFVFAILALLLFHPDNATACSCGYSDPCNAFASASIVFIGQVIEGSEKVEIQGKTDRSASHVAGKVRFTVEEVFKGALSSEVMISVSSNLNTSCGPYALIQGQKYVVYAYGDLPKLSTGVCTRTSRIVDATEDLQFLRNLPAEGTGGRLSGRLWADENKSRTTPLSNVTVIVRDAENNSIKAVTDSKGDFELTNLKPGKYTVEPVFPKYYISRPSKTEVIISDRGCTNVAFEAKLDGRITGRAFDVNNRPVSLMLILESTDPLSKSSHILGHSYEYKNGKFEITGIPPGSYYLFYKLYSEDWKNDQKYYYPGVRKPEEAKEIKVELGQQLEGIDFQVPPEFTAQVVEGVVVWPDGSPAAKVEVMLLCYENPKPNGYMLESGPPHTTTDEHGRFRLPGFKGMSYWVEARGRRKELNQEKVIELHSPARQLIIEKDLSDVKVVLSEKGGSGGCGDSLKRK
jgi:hypothetical protein